MIFIEGNAAKSWFKFTCFGANPWRIRFFWYNSGNLKKKIGLLDFDFFCLVKPVFVAETVLALRSKKKSCTAGVQLQGVLSSTEDVWCRRSQFLQPRSIQNSKRKVSLEEKNLSDICALCQAIQLGYGEQPPQLKTWTWSTGKRSPEKWKEDYLVLPIPIKIKFRLALWFTL